MNVTTSECDVLTCGSVVSTTAQDRNGTNYHIVGRDPGDCIATQEAPKAHHSYKSSKPGHGCHPNGDRPECNQLIANNWQYEDPRSIKESNVEDLAAVAQLLPEDAEGAIPAYRKMRYPKRLALREKFPMGYQRN